MSEVRWLEQTDADIPPEDVWLNACEAGQLAALRFPKRRDDWRLGRWTAKLAVALYLEVPRHYEVLRGIEIRTAPSGAPLVYEGDDPARVRISISHRAGRAICALTAVPAALGCDIELIESRDGGFVSDYFTAEEQASVSRCSPQDRPRLVTLLWSAKESALKAMTVGLRADTRSVAVSLDPEGVSQWNPLSVVCSRGVLHGWHRHDEKWVRTIVSTPVQVDTDRLRPRPLAIDL